MNDPIESIADLKSEWDSLQPLSPENERRLWQKLRLEWNYHSNRIEGNTLTYGETEMFFLHNTTHGTHDIRNYVEMKAHDAGIEHLRQLADNSARVIREGDIRDLNKIILKEPFWKPTQTIDGQPTRKQIIPGEYKTLPNNVVTASGETFEFAPPSEVPSRMQALVAWLEEALASTSIDIGDLVAKLHHDFVLIHPFDDGNGRVARLLVNYILLRQGYPPIVVPADQKKEYLAALRLADAGEIDSLADYLRQRLIAVLQLAIRAGKGEKIEEPGDVEKEISLLVRSQEHHRDKVQPKSTEAIKDLYEHGLKELITQAIEKMGSFDPLFLSSKVTVDPQSPAGNNDPLHNFQVQLRQGFKSPDRFALNFHLQSYRGQSKERFNVQTFLQILFSASDYKIAVANKTLHTKLYTEPLMSDERKEVVEVLLAGVLDEIKKKAKSP